MTNVLVNGQLSDAIAATDRGLLYGDGVFETIAIKAGQCCYWRRHLQRLQHGCQRLGLGVVDEAQLLLEAQAIMGETQQGVLKIIITRGNGGRGYRVPEVVKSTRILQLHDWPSYPVSCEATGVRVTLCDTRLGRNPALAGIKHLNRLEQVMARREWDDELVREGLMLDSSGQLVEGTMSNVFLVQAGRLLTPDLTQCGVAGIMRTRVLALASQEHIENLIGPLTVDQLRQADEVFVCNSLIGIWPVLAVDDNHYEKGSVTTRLQALLRTDPSTSL